MCADGTFQLAWGGTGTAPGQFDRPTGLAWTPQGNLVVADAANGRLEAFTADGTLIWTTSATAGTPAHLIRPRGLAVSADGTIAVADSTTDHPRVVYFSASGAYLTETGSSVGLIEPYGLAFDTSGHLWIADRAGGSVLELNDPNTVANRFEAFGADASAIAPVNLTFSGSSMLVLDFAGQQLLQVPSGWNLTTPRQNARMNSADD